MNFVTVGKVILNWEGKAAWQKDSIRNETGHDALLTPNMILALQLSTLCLNHRKLYENFRRYNLTNSFC